MVRRIFKENNSNIDKHQLRLPFVKPRETTAEHIDPGRKIGFLERLKKKLGGIHKQREEQILTTKAPLFDLLKEYLEKKEYVDDCRTDVNNNKLWYKKQESQEELQEAEYRLNSVKIKLLNFANNNNNYMLKLISDLSILFEDKTKLAECGFDLKSQENITNFGFRFIEFLKETEIHINPLIGLYQKDKSECLNVLHSKPDTVRTMFNYLYDRNNSYKRYNALKSLLKEIKSP